MEEYITYHNKIKIKKSTTKLVGTAVAFLFVLGIFIHFGILKAASKSQASKSSPSAAKVSETNKTKKTNTYILPDSDKYKLTDEELKNLTGNDLMMARNEIFARHGYVFKKEPFKSYFESQSWYKKDPTFKGYDSQLSSVERYNIKKILKYENMKSQ